MNDTRQYPSCPELTLLALARELAEAQVRCAVLARARRWSLAGLALAAAAGFGAGAYVASPAVAQTPGAAATALAMPSAAPAASRAQLLAALPTGDRARVEEFEQKVAWISQYMRSSPQFDPGAAIALFLGDMARAMEAVPQMHAEMQVMNGKMNALPFMANEVAGMNAKMGVMADALGLVTDRTFGPAPWRRVRWAVQTSAATPPAASRRPAPAAWRPCLAKP